MFRKLWLFGPTMGILFASLSALIFTVWDWLENPGGIFRDSSGTNWNFVYDTAASWFLPTFLDVTVIASAGHIVFCVSLSIYRTHFSINDDELNT